MNVYCCCILSHGRTAPPNVLSSIKQLGCQESAEGRNAELVKQCEVSVYAAKTSIQGKSSGSSHSLKV